MGEWFLITESFEFYNGYWLCINPLGHALLVHSFLAKRMIKKFIPAMKMIVYKDLTCPYVEILIEMKIIYCNKMHIGINYKCKSWALSISPVSPALTVLPLMESTSLTGDFGNISKRCWVCQRRCRRGDVNGKRPWATDLDNEVGNEGGGLVLVQTIVHVDQHG